MRIRFFGSRNGVGEKLLAGMDRVEHDTSSNTRMTLNICFNYGGRRDLLEAIHAIVQSGVGPEQIDEALVEQHLSSRGTPAPDLIIRTSGEQRLSNFLLWEAAYAELMFFDCYWPDFGEAQMDQALEQYAHRQRRYGA